MRIFLDLLHFCGYNIIMFSNDNYTTYEELGIFELRQLGRELGVYSPTLLKKSELIAQIKLIKSGKLAPFKKTSKQGRPPKEFKTKEIVLDFPKKENIEDLLNSNLEISSLIFMFKVLKNFHNQSAVLVDKTLNQLNDYLKQQQENCKYNLNIDEIGNQNDNN